MIDTSLQEVPGATVQPSDVPAIGGTPAPAHSEAAARGRASWSLERHLLRRLLAHVGRPPVTVELWDGTLIEADAPRAIARLKLHSRAAFWRILVDPWYQFGEAYASGELSIDGELTEFLTAVYGGIDRAPAARRATQRWWRLLHPRSGNSEARSRENIHHHYDLGNDFYRLWLDERLVYTCAYYAEPHYTLEQAQLAKMEHICRKLRLRPGERVVEAGCGWGALALYMARHHGVTVKAYNISKEQVTLAREQARRARLEDRVEFVLEDWRNIRQPCDAFVSVGMLEHVGPRNYRQLASVIDRCLAPHGRGLLHFIGQNSPNRLNPWIERRIFPGAYGPTLPQALAMFEPYDFSVLDVENLRLHYAQTLQHWRERFEQHADRVREMFDEKFVRIWRLYLCGSAAAFACGGLQLFQVLFARGKTNDVPMTREHLYAKPPVPDAEAGNGAPHSSAPRLPR